MDRFLNGKFAIVTGGSRGIGRAITEMLLDAGASVAICGRDAESIDRALAELRPRGNVIGAAADVGNSDDVARLFQIVQEKFGALDVLINNAGVGVFAKVADLTVQQWRQTLDTNLSGVFYCSHAAMPMFRRRGGGYIVNISSLAGKHAFAGGAAYNASKFGLNGFSEAMMLDHRYDNVRVSYIMPGSVNTEFGSGGEGAWKIAPEDVADIVRMILRMPERTLISRVEVRPAKPKQ
jgi:NAD(P)-dependent dehydrogenase (short-subunit alcohol dehydrogenase family)